MFAPKPKVPPIPKPVAPKGGKQFNPAEAAAKVAVLRGRKKGGGLPPGGDSGGLPPQGY